MFDKTGNRIGVSHATTEDEDYHSSYFASLYPIQAPVIPVEHALICPTCGKIIDMRDLGQSLAHGQYNELTGKYECHDPVDVPYESSKKVGDPVEWTKDKKRIDLN